MPRMRRTTGSKNPTGATSARASPGLMPFGQPTPAMIRTRQEDASALFAWLDQFKEQYPQVSIGDRGLQLYDYSNFSGDALHMNIAGARLFTTFLAQRVRMLYPGIVRAAAEG